MEVYPVKTASILPLGKQGENLVRQIQFDLSRWISSFGPGTVQLLHQRSGDEAPYPVAVEQEGNLAVWTVTNADTAAAGTGRAELQYYVGDALAKSEIWMTKVLAALEPAGETPPEAQQGWVDQVLQAGTAAAEAARKATQIAADVAALAEQVGQDAATAAQAGEAALAAQKKAETAQNAAAAAQQAAEDAANSTGANVEAATDAAARAESAAQQAADALAELQVLYQQMKTYAVQAIQAVESSYTGKVDAINTAGDAQVERVATEGTKQVAAAKDQADRAEVAAGNAADSATEAGQALQGAEDARDKAGQSAADAEAAAEASKNGADRAEAAAIHQPYPNPDTGTWWAWDVETGAYKDTGETYNGNVMYAAFDLDPVTGELHMTTPDRYAGPEFAINDQGYLEVSISA